MTYYYRKKIIQVRKIVNIFLFLYLTLEIVTNPENIHMTLENCEHSLITCHIR